MKKETKDKIGKLYPIFLPPVVLIAGILATIFFFVGPVGKGQWDILAIGIIAMVLGLATFIVLLVEIRKKK